MLDNYDLWKQHEAEQEEALLKCMDKHHIWIEDYED